MSPRPANGVVMPEFLFEIDQEGKSPFIVQNQSLADIAAVWCQREPSTKCERPLS